MGAGDGLVSGVYQIGWNRRRAIVARMMRRAFVWRSGCLKIAHGSVDGRMVGIERIVWVQSVNNVSCRGCDTAGKVMVSCRSGWCEVVRIMR